MANLYRCKTDGSKVRRYSLYTDISSGTWSGATLSSSSYVYLASSSINSTWTYKFDKRLDLTKVQSIEASFIEKVNGIRFSRGYASSSTTEQFYYIPIVSIHGSSSVGTNGKLGGITNNSSYLTVEGINYTNKLSSTILNAATFSVNLYEDRIVFNFTRDSNGHNWGAIMATNPEFYFNISYID